MNSSIDVNVNVAGMTEEDLGNQVRILVTQYHAYETAAKMIEDWIVWDLYGRYDDEYIKQEQVRLAEEIAQEETETLHGSFFDTLDDGVPGEDEEDGIPGEFQSRLTARLDNEFGEKGWRNDGE